MESERSDTKAAGRSFYRYTIKVEVLAERPMPDTDLESIAIEMAEGEYSGVWSIESVETLSGRQLAEFMLKEELDPSFFELTPEGNDIKRV